MEQANKSNFFTYFFAILGGAAILAVVAYIGSSIFHGSQSNVARDIEIGRFSACIKDSDRSTQLTDAQFSEEWLASSKGLKFTPADVDKVIRECQKNGKVRINTVTGEPLIDTPERKERLEKYHQKFLNREFSALREK